MSKALDYLGAVRGDALGHYFAFRQDCGKHLDPKTRALISVITKVDAQTERGLRQYLRRALGAGCTPLEVLDALLMAFPTLGLAKIVWAVDVILALDLPEFRPEALRAAAAAPRWHDVMAADALAAGEARRVECDGRGLFVYRAASASEADGDAWRVHDSRCPHQGTDIPPEALQGRTLTCPKHGWAFDVTSGACAAKGERALTRWPSKIAEGRLLARW